MHKKEVITENPAFWVTVVLLALYAVLTALAQLMPLSGKIAHIVFMGGEIAVLPLGLSILVSAAMLFSWKHYEGFYLPFLISALTVALLYLAWIAWGPTHTSTLNSEREMFYYHTGVELPSAMSDVKEFDDIDGFPADGDAELSFHLNRADLQQWMLTSGFKWKHRVDYKSGETLNEFTDNGSLIFKDRSDIEYMSIDRTPPKLKQSLDDISNVTTIFVNPTEGWVLVRDHDI